MLHYFLYVALINYLHFTSLLQVTHNILHGRLHTWLTEYLANRGLLVSIDDAKSATRKINAGVPQGSEVAQMVPKLEKKTISFF